MSLAVSFSQNRGRTTSTQMSHDTQKIESYCRSRSPSRSRSLLLSLSLSHPLSLLHSLSLSLARSPSLSLARSLLLTLPLSPKTFPRSLPSPHSLALIHKFSFFLSLSRPIFPEQEILSAGKNSSRAQYIYPASVCGNLSHSRSTQ